MAIKSVFIDFWKYGRMDLIFRQAINKRKKKIQNVNRLLA